MKEIKNCEKAETPVKSWADHIVGFFKDYGLAGAIVALSSVVLYLQQERTMFITRVSSLENELKETRENAHVNAELSEKACKARGEVEHGRVVVNILHVMREVETGKATMSEESRHLLGLVVLGRKDN